MFGEPVDAAAMSDGLVQHAEVVNLKGDDHQLRDRDLERMTMADEQC